MATTATSNNSFPAIESNLKLPANGGVKAIMKTGGLRSPVGLVPAH
jgi:hypothetical protein